MLDLEECIKKIEQSAGNPSRGLPESVFLLLGRLTPYINVDLLIKNEKGQTLLTWRKAGEVVEPGWHLPGGIIRYKEDINKRIYAVAKNELQAEVEFEEKPIAVNQIMLEQTNRAHFISLLYACTLVKEPNLGLLYKRGKPRTGQWAWHDRCPKDLISPHEIYKNFL